MQGQAFSQAAENNKQPITEILKTYMHAVQSVLEIGSGTGQHMSYFSTLFPHVVWQPSDVAQNFFPNQTNILKPLILDVGSPSTWPSESYDMVYTANTCHIMSWPEVVSMFQLVGQVLKPGGVFVGYGPFKFEGQFTSESNRVFDEFLKQKKLSMGLRDVEHIQAEAAQNHLELLHVHAMPANNHSLVFQAFR